MPRPFIQWLVVGLAGALGALARYGLYKFLDQGLQLPYYADTLAINTLGVLLLGYLSTIAIETSRVLSQYRPLVLTGFLGAFTTFSTFVHNIDELEATGRFALELGDLFCELALALMFMALGIYLAERTNAALLARNRETP